MKPTPDNIYLVAKSVAEMIVDDHLDLKNKIKYALGSQVIEFKIKDAVVNLPRKSLRMFVPFTTITPEAIDEMNSFLRLTKRMRCFIDVGAFYGVFSAFFTSLNKDSIAYAIEPSDEPFEMLNKFIRVNPTLKINPFKIAFSDDNEGLKMKADWKHFVAVRKDEQGFKVKSMTLDKFIKSNKINPEAIKIDTEGWEYAILKGGKEYLNRNNPIIFLEIHPKLLAGHDIKVSDLVDLIHSMGFNIYNSKGKLLNSSELLFSKYLSCRVICSKKLIFMSR